MRRRRVLGAMVAMPERPWWTALQSLIPQCDQVAIYLNGFTTFPDELRVLGDRCWFHLDPDNRRAAEGNLFWCDRWDGIYVPAGDDLQYPPDYVSTLCACIHEYAGKVMAAVHGKRYEGEKIDVGVIPFNGQILHNVARNQWINYPGTGGIAFDTAHIRPPTEWLMRNTADAQLAVWCQRNRVPIRMLAHRRGWVEYLLDGDAWTIWKDEAANKLARRRSVAEAWSPWVVYKPEGVYA